MGTSPTVAMMVLGSTAGAGGVFRSVLTGEEEGGGPEEHGLSVQNARDSEPREYHTPLPLQALKSGRLRGCGRLEAHQSVRLVGGGPRGPWRR